MHTAQLHACTDLPDVPMFSRNNTSDKTELRGLAPSDMVQALDAFAYAEGLNRNDYVNRVLAEHVKKEVHRTMIRERMLRGNPLYTEASGAVVDASAEGTWSKS